jgi:hypothetical protein
MLSTFVENVIIFLLFEPESSLILTSSVSCIELTVLIAQVRGLRTRFVYYNRQNVLGCLYKSKDECHLPACILRV